MKNTKRFVAVLFCALFPLLLPACYVGPAPGPGGPVVVLPPPGGPPPHAPAHGYRRQQMYAYRYYPAAQVYFALDRRAYFYYDAGSWRMSVSLPYELRIRLGDHVVIEMDSDRPFRDFDKHRAKYPPGKYKGKYKR